MLLVFLVCAAYADDDDSAFEDDMLIHSDESDADVKKGAKEPRKICGSDGNVYASRKAFRSHICEKQAFDLMARPMVCCEGDTEDVAHSGKRGKRRGGKRGNKRKCAALKKSFVMCGSDSVTYTSIADFKRAQCDNDKLRVFHRGKCGDCEAIRCPKRRINNKKGKKGEKKMKRKSRVICGSDGKEYTSFCLFTMARCQSLADGNTLKRVKKVDGDCPTKAE